MNSSTLTLEFTPKATGIDFSDNSMLVSLADGRVVQAPLTWYPRLEAASGSERTNFELFQEGVAIHWPEIDEDIRIVDLLAGRRSCESTASFDRWMKERTN